MSAQCDYNEAYEDGFRAAQARIADLERQNADLQAANNTLLIRARNGDLLNVRAAALLVEAREMISEFLRQRQGGTP